MVKDGIYYGLGFGLAAVATGLVFSWLCAIPLIGLGAFCMYFFRDPHREIPEGDVAVSPADGVIVHIRDTPDGGHRVSIFLNVFDVHVNRSPVAGRITEAEYNHGRFMMAHKEDASEENERNALTIQPDDPNLSPIKVAQIAGLVARRIVCYKKVGDHLGKGERLGLIKFGSRTDIHLGPEWQLQIRKGQRVAGGSSVVAGLGEAR